MIGERRRLRMRSLMLRTFAQPAAARCPTYSNSIDKMWKMPWREEHQIQRTERTRRAQAEDNLWLSSPGELTRASWLLHKQSRPSVNVRQEADLISWLLR